MLVTRGATTGAVTSRVARGVGGGRDPELPGREPALSRARTALTNRAVSGQSGTFGPALVDRRHGSPVAGRPVGDPLLRLYLANGTVDLEILPDPGYVPAIIDSGSALEKIFAVFSNVLEVDADGRVTNPDHASHRAAQWIRGFIDHDYVVEPSFEAWETELV